MNNMIHNSTSEDVLFSMISLVTFLLVLFDGVVFLTRLTFLTPILMVFLLTMGALKPRLALVMRGNWAIREVAAPGMSLPLPKQ